MVWDNSFDLSIELCVETKGDNTIDPTVNGKNVGFYSKAPTDHEFHQSFSGTPRRFSLEKLEPAPVRQST